MKFSWISLATKSDFTILLEESGFGSNKLRISSTSFMLETTKLVEEIARIVLMKKPVEMALPDLWLKLYWMIHFAFLAFAEGLAVPRY